MADTWIQTAWTEDGEGPWLIAAYDEITFDEWGREPDFYRADIEKGKVGEVRELRLYVSQLVIDGLFAQRSVEARTEPLTRENTDG